MFHTSIMSLIVSLIVTESCHVAHNTHPDSCPNVQPTPNWTLVQLAYPNQYSGVSPTLPLETHSMTRPGTNKPTFMSIY